MSSDGKCGPNLLLTYVAPYWCGVIEVTIPDDGVNKLYEAGK